MASGNAICGSPCNTNFTNCVKFFNNSPDKLITAGNFNMNVWTYDAGNNKLRPTDATLGTLKRVFKSVVVDANDEYAYCGTTTGDVLQVRLRIGVAARVGCGVGQARGLR